MRQAEHARLVRPLSGEQRRPARRARGRGTEGFTKRHAAELQKRFQKAAIHVVDGQAMTWYLSRTELGLECSRCVEPYVLPVDRQFDLRFLPAAAGEPQAEDEDAEVEEDDVSITFYRDEQVDLDELGSRPEPAL